MTVQLVSVAGLVGYLDEYDQSIRSYALKKLDQLVDEYWAEIADSVSKIEELYEDETFPDRKLAALVASKVFYHLGEFEESMMFALGAGDLFDISAKSEYVQTIVEKCVDKYIYINSVNASIQDSVEETPDADTIAFEELFKNTPKNTFLSNGALSRKPEELDSRLQDIVERMFNKCFEAEDYRPALGIAIEARRLDVVERGITLAGQKGKGKAKQGEKDDSESLIQYVLDIAMHVVQERTFRRQLLRLLLNLLLQQPSRDYFAISKCVVHLEDQEVAGKLLRELVSKEDSRSLITAYQIAFDLQSSSTQEFINKVTQELPSTNDSEGGESKKEDKQESSESTALLKDDENKALDSKSPSEKYYKAIKSILRGTKTIDLHLEFLHRNNHTDVTILNKLRDSLEPRSSIFHSAVTFSTAIMNAGTTSDSFFKDNLDWLGKAVNWSKFSATAALGVIQKGNLVKGKDLLNPYFPKAGVASGSPYSQGGSIFALGIVYANHGSEIVPFIRDMFKNASEEVVQHGGALGLGVAAMATHDLEIYEDIKSVLWSDSAIVGEATGLAMGLVMLGSGNASCLAEMIQYAHETQHEKIVRGLAMGIALINFGRQSAADELVRHLLEDADPLLRYGGVFTIALAYCGTASNDAVRQLLHVAVSDVNDDVRRAAVLSLGFILFRKPHTVPRIVELLAESYNPHVRYGATMALGISCAGTGLDEAIDLLEPMMKDPTDFVRQGASIALAMILMEQNDQSNSKVSSIRKTFEKSIGEKHEDAMAKFGSALALGIIDAGGRNCTIGLQTQTGSLNVSGIVGMAIFMQYWYWFPLTHFLSLSFVPTGIIGLNQDLEIPDFTFTCNSRPSLFEYPPVVQESEEKGPEKVATAVLSTTAKARQRAKQKAKEAAQAAGDAMDIEQSTPAPESGDKMEIEEEVKENEEKKEVTEKKKKEKEPTSFSVQNMSRVVPAQLKYISFDKDSRYVPVKKATGGILLLEDTRPSEPTEILERKLVHPAPPAPGPGQTTGGAPQTPVTTLMGDGGTAAAVGVLTAEDDEGEEAPVPEPFEYETDTEEQE